MPYRSAITAPAGSAEVSRTLTGKGAPMTSRRAKMIHDMAGQRLTPKTHVASTTAVAS
jgi:hypothetical protein